MNWNKTNNKRPNQKDYFILIICTFSKEVKPLKKSTLLLPQAVALMAVSSGKTHSSSCSSSKDTGSATFPKKLLKSTNISLDIAVCGRCRSVSQSKCTIKWRFCKVVILMYVEAEDTEKRTLQFISTERGMLKKERKQYASCSLYYLTACGRGSQFKEDRIRGSLTESHFMNRQAAEAHHGYNLFSPEV